MVTYEVCDGWKESKYNRKILSQYNLAAPSSGHMTRKSELIVTNYPLKANSSFLESNVDTEDMREADEFFSVSNLAGIYKESNMLPEKQIGNFALIHQWWKVKHLEGKDLNSFILTTTLKNDLVLDNNPLEDNFKESFFYIKPSKYDILRINESVTFLTPGTDLNMTGRPSWIKIIDMGKISILESTDLEKTIELSGNKLKGIFTATRENKNSDFWVLKLKEAAHSHSECMECNCSPKYEVLWANGKGHAWFCENHFKSWSASRKDDIDYIKEVKDGTAASHFADNNNPNIKDILFK